MPMSFDWSSKLRDEWAHQLARTRMELWTHGWLNWAWSLPPQVMIFDRGDHAEMRAKSLKIQRGQVVDVSLGSGFE